MVGTPSVERCAPAAFAHPTFSVIPGHANGPREARLDGVNPESSHRRGAFGFRVRAEEARPGMTDSFFALTLR
jgi:hypothetical protein